MPGVTRRIAGRDRAGAAFEILVPAPVADAVVRERFEDAEAALRELDDVASAWTGPDDLVRSLLATESLPGRDIMALAAGRSVRPSAGIDRAQRRFEQACREGAGHGPLDVGALCRAHRRIVPGGGTTRRGLVWVGAVPSPAQAVFVPPPPAEVRRLLADLAAFLDRDDLCPVAQTAVAFAQLVFVHPFADGNGRLGRWLVQTNLRRRGVVGTLAPPLGLHLASHAGAFADAHRAYRDGDLDRWCTFAVEGLVTVATRARQLLGGDRSAD
jgi:hypothetical protein